MSTTTPAEFVPLGLADPPQQRWLRAWHNIENLVVVLALGIMIFLPVAESLFRWSRHWGVQCSIPGAVDMTRHLTLVIGMIGGAIAARENRMLALSTLTTALSGRWCGLAVIFSYGVAAALTAMLALASLTFVRAEVGQSRILAYGIPAWTVQTLMPVGFVLVAGRLWWHAADRWRGRLAAVGVSAVIGAVAVWGPVEPGELVLPGLIVLGLATMLGAPMFAVLGGSALILFWGGGEPVAAIPVTQYSLSVNPSLPTIPLFTLAGYFLAEGGASKRFVRVFDAVFGCVRGGPAIVTALVCAFFTSFTGASGVTILALGGLLMPVLLAAKYSERDALGLLTGAGSLGVFLPPCLPLILYAIIAANQGAEISIEGMFLGGAVPAMVMVGLTAAWGVWRSPRGSGKARWLNPREAGQAIWDAKWELLIPVVAMAGLFGGFATPVEAAAWTAFYAFVVETWVYRDLQWRNRSDGPTRATVGRVMTECGLLVGGVLLILGVALGLTNYLVDAEVPTRAVDWVKASIESPLVFLLVLNLFLLVVGCLMDIYSAIVVVVPLLVPMGVAFGIDPIHLGIIFLANLQVGYLTPPVGMNLFLAAYRFGKPLPEVFRAVLPMLIVFLLGVLLITYVPPLTTWLPSALGK